MASDVRVGTAGWSIPRAFSARFDSTGTHLERYSRLFDCAEINSSFHRPHAATTYAKWRASTPPAFRFAVKVPRAITHDLKLRRAREPFTAFLTQTDGLAEKRGPLLLQLPPSLNFDGPVVTRFLNMVRSMYAGPIVCEDPFEIRYWRPEGRVSAEEIARANVANTGGRVFRWDGFGALERIDND